LGDIYVFEGDAIMKKERGSTRAESLAAIIAVTMIITTAMAAVIPAMNKARESAIRATCAEQMKQVAMGLSTYANEYSDNLPWYGGIDPNYPAPFTCPAETINREIERHIYVAYRGSDPFFQKSGVPIPMRLGCLYASGIITNARTFYCPANVDAAYRYESYINPAPPNTSYDWGTLPQQINNGTNNWVRTGYIYYPIDNHITKDDFGTPLWTARRFSSMEASMPFMTDMISNTAQNPEPRTGLYVSGMDNISHNDGKVLAFNAVFKDGHVVFVKGKRAKTSTIVKGLTVYKDVFDEDLWDGFARGTWDCGSDYCITGDSYRYFYYTIFKLVQP
jgi:hypothetical protein